MRPDKGKPSGVNKSQGTGTPSNIRPGNIKNDTKLTDKYTVDDNAVAEGVRVKNPNRNVDKGKATNAHGYKNG